MIEKVEVLDSDLWSSDLIPSEAIFVIDQTYIFTLLFIFIHFRYFWIRI